MRDFICDLLFALEQTQAVLETVVRVKPQKNESKITKVIHLIDFKMGLLNTNVLGGAVQVVIPTRVVYIGASINQGSSMSQVEFA